MLFACLSGEMLRDQEKLITNYVQKYATAQVHLDPYVSQMYKLTRTRIFAGFSKSVTAELLPPKPLGWYKNQKLDMIWIGFIYRPSSQPISPREIDI